MDMTGDTLLVMAELEEMEGEREGKGDGGGGGCIVLRHWSWSSFYPAACEQSLAKDIPISPATEKSPAMENFPVRNGS